MVETGHIFCGYYNIIYSSRNQLNKKTFCDQVQVQQTKYIFLKKNYWNIISEATKTRKERGNFVLNKNASIKVENKGQNLLELIGGSEMLL